MQRSKMRTPKWMVFSLPASNPGTAALSASVMAQSQPAARPTSS